MHNENSPPGRWEITTPKVESTMSYKLSPSGAEGPQEQTGCFSWLTRNPGAGVDPWALQPSRSALSSPIWIARPELSRGQVRAGDALPPALPYHGQDGGSRKWGLHVPKPQICLCSQKGGCGRLGLAGVHAYSLVHADTRGSRNKTAVGPSYTMLTV